MEMLLGGSQDKEAGLHLCSLNRSGAGLLANVSRRTAGIFFFKGEESSRRRNQFCWGMLKRLKSAKRWSLSARSERERGVGRRLAVSYFCGNAFTIRGALTRVESAGGWGVGGVIAKFEMEI